MSLTPAITFGNLLKQVRKRARMTQGDLAAAVGYSISFVCALEQNRRLPDVDSILQQFIPALGLQEEPQLAVRLVELAALARGERPPVTITHKRETQILVTDELTEGVIRLPAPPTQLVGRQQEVRSLGHRLLGHSGCLLTLVGPPGIGKTTLALAVAEHVHLHYPDGAVFMPLAAISDPTLVADALLTTLKVPHSSSKPSHTRLIEHLRRKEMLLVLDNFEQIIAAAPLLADLLAECAGLRLLVTSRERLHLRAEQRYRVPPLPLEAAVELFAQRAAAVNSDFVLTATNRPTVEAICQRLDRLPLAIELCAGQIELLSPTQLLAGLQASSLDLLAEGAQDLPPQQRTLRTAIGRSYALLPEEERTLLRSLGVFLGGFDLAAVAAVVDGNAETRTWRLHDEPIPPSLVSKLRSLVSKSLVHTETLPTGEQRFLLLETIREYALEQMRAHGEEALLRQRHYLAFLHLFRTGDSGHLRGAEATAWFARLELEQDNLRAALQWTLDTGRYAEAAWLLVVVHYFWAINGHRYETARWLARLLPHRQTLAVELQIILLTEFVVAAGGSGEFPDLDMYRAEIIKLMEICPSKQIQSVAWHFLAQTHEEQARAIELARAASEAPELSPEFGALADADFVLAANQVGYADSLLHQGEVAQATMLTKDSLDRFRRQGNQEFMAECLGALANFALLQGNLTEAHAQVQEAMAIGTTHNLRIVHAEWQWLLGLVTLYHGDAREARRLLEGCLPLCLEIKNTYHLALVYMVLAETALWEGDLDQGAVWLGQSLTYHTSPQRITATELQRLWVAARLATARQQYQHAATLFGLADQVHDQIHYAITGPMRNPADAALATVREALEPLVFAEAFVAGQQMSLAEAFATILTPAQVTGGFGDSAPNVGIR